MTAEMQSQSRAGPASLVPPLFERGGADNFKRSGRILAETISPRDDTVAVYAARGSIQAEEQPVEEQRIYLAQPQQAPLAERRTFVTDTLVVYSACQELFRKLHKNGHSVPENEEGMWALNKLSLDFVTFIKECCAHCSEAREKRELLQLSPEHYMKVYSCFELFTLLYVPDPVHENAPVGDELMEWLNTHFIEPSTEEGDNLSALDKPWEDETFWPYLTRTTLRGLTRASAFFLDTLSKHPSPFLQDASRDLKPLVVDHPRLCDFVTEREYMHVFRRWRDRLKTLRLELGRVPEIAREDGGENWWEPFSDIVGILEGRGDTLKRVCTELGADWKEVCVAWGIFIDTRLRRQDLAEVVAEVVDEMPPDPTNLEDMIHSSLFRGKPKEALSDAARLDIWLPVHMSTLQEPLQLIDSQPDDSGLSLREHYTLSYVDFLRLDPALWRITVDYLYTCGEIGREMADQVLMHVPLRLQKSKDTDPASADAAQIRAGNLTGVLKDVLQTCHEHQREEVRRLVCRVAAQTFLQDKEYGLAVSYCTSAEDWPGLGRIVEHILNEFVTEGPEKFAHHVANVAPSLQALSTRSGAHGVFVYRLMFAARFAEFHRWRLEGNLQDAAFDLVAMFREDIAPKSWWAVLLSDAVDLLQNHEAMLFSSEDACLLLHRLEEIHIRSSQGSSEDYLSVLAKMTKSGGEKHALQRLQTVRLALARYYARCGVIRVGGKTAMHKI